MPTGPFPDPRTPPTDAAWAAVIGKGHGIVSSALDQLRAEKKTITHAYTYSKTSGWHLTCDKDRQRLFYLFPRRKDFLLKLVLNDKGVALLAKAEAGTAVKDKLRKAKKYAEGTLLEFSAAEIDTKLLVGLLRIKIASVA